jgi:hypothetical protein
MVDEDAYRVIEDHDAGEHDESEDDLATRQLKLNDQLSQTISLLRDEPRGKFTL